MSGMSSEFGEWLDDVLGTLNTVVFFFGITWGAYRQRQDPVAWMLGFAVVCGVLVIQFNNIIAWLLAFKRERQSSTDRLRLEKAELRSILKSGRLKKALMFVRLQGAPNVAMIWTMASLAALSVTPSNSYIIFPGVITSTQNSGSPLPFPILTSAGFFVTGFQGKALTQSFPFLLT